MPALTAKMVKPESVPTGYAWRRQLEGASAHALGRHPDQIVLVYTLGWTQEDWSWPLVVAAAPAGAPPLLGTEHRRGRHVDLGIPGVRAVYHNGIWVLGPGPDEQSFGAGVIHWDSSTVHSLTVRHSDVTWAVRGPKTRGADFDVLVRMARSTGALGS